MRSLEGDVLETFFVESVLFGLSSFSFLVNITISGINASISGSSVPILLYSMAMSNNCMLSVSYTLITFVKFATVLVCESSYVLSVSL